MGVLSVCYGLVAYALFLGTFLYLIGFVGNLGVPTSIDSGTPAPLAQAVLVDVLLLVVFAAQHSVMARPAFKRWWTRLVPTAVERSTYVLLSSLALVLLYGQWRPIPLSVWSFESGPAAVLLEALFWLGWGLVLVSTFLLSHFELFGLRQVLAHAMRRALPESTFKTPLLYGYVRHPIYLGWLIAFWATPAMSAGHLLFALGNTVYILLAIGLEERDLVAHFGDTYRHYQQRVGMLLPRPRRPHLRGASALSQPQPGGALR